ncbi:DNA-primase RepB domain-containing protein, partial [Aeromonas caviae]|uniref:DNA-primase RepB domain-containing protein n=1 Tax=Aeromonas caviae TaxID=648 RepID=UPI001CC43392
EYDADPASADSHHYGRLAGFTNQKPKHTTKTGYQPWGLWWRLGRWTLGTAPTADTPSWLCAWASGW